MIASSTCIAAKSSRTSRSLSEPPSSPTFSSSRDNLRRLFNTNPSGPHPRTALSKTDVAAIRRSFSVRITHSWTLSVAEFAASAASPSWSFWTSSNEMILIVGGVDESRPVGASTSIAEVSEAAWSTPPAFSGSAVPVLSLFTGV